MNKYNKLTVPENIVIIVTQSPLYLSDIVVTLDHLLDETNIFCVHNLNRLTRLILILSLTDLQDFYI